MNVSSAKKILFSLMMLGIGTSLFAQRDPEGRDRSESPYFSVSTPRGDKETLPLLSTGAFVNIAGVIANVRVNQIYVNRGKTPIEASYIFPASTRAAVYSMQFTLGKRIVKAEIKEKQEAQQIYNDAKAQGKTAALLQEHRPNVFQMNLANIMPGDTIKVEMCYTELLACENNTYEFVYPTVVGPRYTSDTTADGKPMEKWISTPYTNEGKSPTYLFDIKTQVNGGVPLQDLNCSSHEVDINFQSPNTATIDLKSSDKLRGNKDFILKYRLTGNRVQEGVLLYEGEKENYFLMMMQPSATVAKSDLPGREYIFIMDVSGSQSGFPLEVSKELMRNLLKDLRDKDVFNVMIFEGRAGFMSETSMKASEENIEKAVTFINSQSAGGGTEMLTAIKKAMTFPKTSGYSRTFAISTDGFISAESSVFDYIKNNLSEANFFAFGIGSSVNRHLIEGIAHAGMGEMFVVTKKEEASVTADKFKNYISNPVLTNIKVSYNGFNAYDMTPVNVPDVFALRPIVIFGKYTGSANGGIKITGVNADGNYTRTLMLSDYKPLKENSALTYLWARDKIRGYELDGKIGKQTKKEITELGLKYNLLTAYTSFVAVDNEVRNKTGKTDSIVQPIPLPEGVSQNAVQLGSVAYGNASGGTGSYSYTWSNNAPASNGLTTSYQKPTVMAKNVESYSMKRAEVALEKKIVQTQAVKVESLKEESDKSVKSNQGFSAGKKDIKGQNGEVSVRQDTTRTQHETVEDVPVPDVMAKFPGGEAEMMKFIKKNMVYPKAAKDKNIQGNVYVKFKIDKDGSVKSVVVVKSPNEELSKEALRVIALMPKWTPAQTKGKNVSCWYTLPVSFVLASDKK